MEQRAHSWGHVTQVVGVRQTEPRALLTPMSGSEQPSILRWLGGVASWTLCPCSLTTAPFSR